MILNLNPRVVSFHYTLKNSKGEQLESSFGSDPLMFLEGVGQIIPGLEKEIQMMKAGDKKVITVKASDAYGEVEADIMIEEDFSGKHGDSKVRCIPKPFSTLTPNVLFEEILVRFHLYALIRT